MLKPFKAFIIDLMRALSPICALFHQYSIWHIRLNQEEK
jgi:hypothetical protein